MVLVNSRYERAWIEGVTNFFRALVLIPISAWSLDRQWRTAGTDPVPRATQRGPCFPRLCSKAPAHFDSVDGWTPESIAGGDADVELARRRRSSAASAVADAERRRSSFVVASAAAASAVADAANVGRVRRRRSSSASDAAADAADVALVERRWSSASSAAADDEETPARTDDEGPAAPLPSAWTTSAVPPGLVAVAVRSDDDAAEAPRRSGGSPRGSGSSQRPSDGSPQRP